MPIAKSRAGPKVPSRWGSSTSCEATSCWKWASATSFGTSLRSSRASVRLNGSHPGKRAVQKTSGGGATGEGWGGVGWGLSLIHISEPTRRS
eukprot:4363370-Prymnesium_polylepis.1